MGLEAQALVAIVRTALAGAGAVREVKMFGGIGFMLNGNMLAGASKHGLLLRVGKESEAEALARPGTRPMVMRGRRMEGYLYIDPPALTEEAVRGGIRLALAFVQTLPAKTAAKPKGNKAKREP